MNQSDNTQLDQLIENVGQIATFLYQSKIEEAQNMLGEALQHINEIYSKMVINKIKYSQVGVDIPSEVLCNQLGNLENAVTNKNIMALADTFMYEIREGLLFYREIKDAL